MAVQSSEHQRHHDGDAGDGNRSHARAGAGGLAHPRDAAACNGAHGGGRRRQLQFSAGDIDFIFKKHQLVDVGLEALLELAFDGTNEVTVVGMTSSSVEISASGYSDQDVSEWSLSIEND